MFFPLFEVSAIKHWNVVCVGRYNGNINYMQNKIISAQ